MADEIPSRELAVRAAALPLARVADALAESPMLQYPSMKVIRAPEYEGSSLAVERAEYGLSTMTPEEQEAILKEPTMTPAAFQSLIRQNSTNRFSSEDAFVLDGEILLQIDLRIREPLFITAGSKACTEEQLLATYPFEDMGVNPREAFAQQELGIFPARGSDDPSVREYMCRDLGTEDEFITVQDLVARSARGATTLVRPLIRAVKTKVFLARDGWDDFMALHRQVRGIARFGKSAIARSATSGGSNMLTRMLGGMAAAPMALESSAQLIERAAQEKVEMERREQAMRQREEELQRRTEELLEMLAGMRDEQVDDK